MIRPAFVEIILFLLPFVLYAVYLLATRSGIIGAQFWPLRHIVGLTVAALLLVIGSFIFFAHFSGAPPGADYVPAHIDNGKFVPGTIK